MKREARADATLKEAQQKQEAVQQAEKAKVEAFVDSGKAPFFRDVLKEMVALSRLRTEEAGREITLEELYERACWANPDVRAVLIARIKAEVIHEFMRKQAIIREEVAKTIRTARRQRNKRHGRNS